MAVQEEYRTDYYMMNVRRYADSKNVSIDSASLEINRLLSSGLDRDEGRKGTYGKKTESLFPLLLSMAFIGVMALSFFISSIFFGNFY